MAETEYPVTVAVERGGRVEQVRVGTAVRSGEGFVLRLGDLRIQATGAQASAGGGYGGGGEPRRSAPPPAEVGGGGAGGGGVTFPNYGRSKGQAIYGATLQDLEYYAAGCRRTLGNPEKSRWHDKERVLLAAIEAEMIRQKGMPDMPRESGGGGGGAGGGSEPAPYFDERPPPADDDIPF